jgi:PAS domain S-box-containing protein
MTASKIERLLSKFEHLVPKRFHSFTTITMLFSLFILLMEGGLLTFFSQDIIGQFNQFLEGTNFTDEEVQAYISLIQHDNELMFLSFVAVLGIMNAIIYFVEQQLRKKEQSLDDEIVHVKELNEEVEEKQAFNKAVLDTVLDGIITIDEKGIIHSANPAVTTIFGFTQEELLGQNVKILMPDPYRKEHDAYLERYNQTHEKHIIGIGREVQGQRKNGEIFPLDLAVSEMVLPGKTMFAGVVRDITERKAAEAMKNEFVSTVSHELRTPLTSIRGSIGLLKGGAAGQLPEKAAQLLDIAYNNTERLLMLINDILDMSKIEAGKMNFDFKPVKVDDLLHHAVEANSAYAEQYGVSFAIENHAVESYVYGDEHRLMQVLSNLMSNAAKFAPKGSKIMLSATKRRHQIRISVTDQGPGIPLELRKTIFEKFTQADSSDTRKVGGTGLGLNISKLIVEKHNGRIDFFTEEGVGTTFFFDLAELILSEQTDETPQLNKLEKQRKILIVEDEPDIAALLRMMLTKNGYDTDLAKDAHEAEKLLQTKDYDAITLDIMLPGKHGPQLYEELRQTAKHREIPVIFISAKARDLKESMHGTLDEKVDWLEKPIAESELVEALQHQFGDSIKKAVKSILHVEDDPDIQKLVGLLLEDSYTLDVAGTLQEAEQKLSQRHYDLVLLDIGLPDGSGLDLLERIKALPDGPEVIIFSADDYQRQRVEGVQTTLTKSKTSNEELVKTVSDAVNDK